MQQKLCFSSINDNLYLMCPSIQTPNRGGRAPFDCFDSSRWLQVSAGTGCQYLSYTVSVIVKNLYEYAL